MRLIGVPERDRGHLEIGRETRSLFPHEFHVKDMPLVCVREVILVQAGFVDVSLGSSTFLECHADALALLV
ncbi:MAG: hypothetical protein ACYTBX_07940 [Planctomycetota bacterium]